MKRLIVLFAVMAMLVPVGVMAQATPKAGNLTDLMPSSQIFGADWTSYGGYTPKAVEQPYFLDGVGAYFGGDSGQRVQVVILQTAPGRANENDAWEAMSDLFVANVYDDNYDIDYSREAEFDDLPLPAGIADAKRTDGTEGFYRYAICIGLYAIEPDILVYVKAEGPIVPITGMRNGGNACDKIAELIAKNHG